MTLIEHLTELRRRLVISFVAIGVGAVIGWILYDWTIELLLDPYCGTLDDAADCRLYVRNPLETFNVRLTVAGYSGLIMAMPVLLWQIWRFIAPGLYSHEKRYAVPFITAGVGLFFLGAGLAYWSIPRALQFLQSLGGENFQDIYAPSDYIGFVIKMILAFGIGFEFPIVLIFLQILEMVDNKTLRSGRHYAIVGIVALVAVITPSGDPFTLAVLSVPMYMFYEIAVLFGRLRIRRAKKAAAGRVTGGSDRGLRLDRFQTEVKPPWRTTARLEMLDIPENRDLLPVIWFVFSRKGCDEAATNPARAGVRFTGQAETERIRAIAQDRLAGLEGADLALLDTAGWLDRPERGVANHHAGLVPAFKLIDLLRRLGVLVHEPATARAARRADDAIHRGVVAISEAEVA